MADKNDKDTLSLSDFNNPGFTRQEIEFLIQRLIEVRKNSSLPQAEEDLLIFLVSQLKKLQAAKQEQQQSKQRKEKKEHSQKKNKSQTKPKEQNSNAKREDKKEEIRLLPGGTRQGEVQNKRRRVKPKKDRLNFKRLLKNKLGQFVIINLMTGGNCCKIEGVLCTIESDFIILINKGEFIQLRIKSIAAIKQKISEGDVEQPKKRKIKQLNHYSLNEVKTEESSGDLQVSRQKKSYTENKK